jgi:hypothetical protein
MADAQPSESDEKGRGFPLFQSIPFDCGQDLEEDTADDEPWKVPRHLGGDVLNKPVR